MAKRILYITILLLTIGTINSYAQEQQNVTIELENATLRQFFRSIEKQTTYRFSYRNAIIDDKKDITVSKRNVKVSVLLDEVLQKKGLTYKIVSAKSIVISDKKTRTNSMAKRVTGIVKMANGEPVIGANVTMAGSTIGAITDINGNFSLEVPDDARLTISYIGFNERRTISRKERRIISREERRINSEESNIMRSSDVFEVFYYVEKRIT